MTPKFLETSFLDFLGHLCMRKKTSAEFSKKSSNQDSTIVIEEQKKFKQFSCSKPWNPSLKHVIKLSTSRLFELTIVLAMSY